MQIGPEEFLGVKKDPELGWKTRIDEYRCILVFRFRLVAVDSSHCDDTATRSFDIDPEERYRYNQNR